jgi:hypothetical protein
MADGALTVHGVRLAVPIVEDFAYLARRMRPDEIAQWLALTGQAEYDPNTAARAFCAMQGVTFCLVDPTGLPIAAGGFEPVRPRVVQTWMVGTMEGWEQHWRAITKHARRLIDGLLTSGEAQRVQTYALASRTQAHEWYARGLGQTFEGTHRRFFADGQDAVVYAKVADHG